MSERCRSLLARAARAVVGFAQGSVLLVFGLAILLGVRFLPAGQGARSAPAQPRTYDVTEEFGTIKAMMSASRQSGMSTLILQDPAGQEVSQSGYADFGKYHYFSCKNGGLWTFVRAEEDGRVTLTVQGPTTTSEFHLRQDGSSEVAVTRQDALKTPLGQVAISPEGRASNVAVVLDGVRKPPTAGGLENPSPVSNFSR